MKGLSSLIDRKEVIHLLSFPGIILDSFSPATQDAPGHPYYWQRVPLYLPRDKLSTIETLAPGVVCACGIAYGVYHALRVLAGVFCPFLRSPVLRFSHSLTPGDEFPAPGIF